MKCSKCLELSVIKQGHQNLCEKHYRFLSMRVMAKKSNKSVPTYEELEQLIPKNLICQDCEIKMNWRAKNGRSTVITLQLYRDGSYGLVCLSCNTRHQHMDGDSYRTMPKDHKFCPSCKEIKHKDMYFLDSSKGGILKRKSYCNKCSTLKVKNWIERNRDEYNKKQREYRAKRKAIGNPITRKS